MIAEARDVQFVAIELVDALRATAVHVRGFVFHSSLAVKDVMVARDADEVLLNLTLTPVRRGLSGRFSVDIPVTSGSERVLFGPGKTQIWPRHAPSA